MAVVLGTTLKVGDDKGKVKTVEEGTPANKLTKAEKELAKELNLLVSVPDEEEEEDEDEEDETTETESTEG